MGLRVVVIGCVVLAGCSSCPREGCEALETLVPDSAGVSQIAGIIASESDVVSNGCQECGFTSAPVAAWPRQGEVSTDAQVQEQTAGPALASTTSGNDGQYNLPLEPGDYLICSGIACFSASVVEGHTTTLNIKLIDGVSTGYLGLPGEDGTTQSSALLRQPGP